MNDILTAALWLSALAIERQPARLGHPRSARRFSSGRISRRWRWCSRRFRSSRTPLARQQLRGLSAMIAGALPGVVDPGVAESRALRQRDSGPATARRRSCSRSRTPARTCRTSHARSSRRSMWCRSSACWRRWSFTGSSVREQRCCSLSSPSVFAIYLLYSPFPEWWYLRFLIPAIVVLLILASAVSVHLLSKANMGGLIPIAAVLLGIIGARAAGDRDAFNLQRMEGRYRVSARARARSIAGQCRADHGVAERQHAVPCGPRNRDVGLARSVVARSRDHLAALAGGGAVFSVRASRRAGISRPLQGPIGGGRPRLAAAIRSRPAGAGSSILPIARVISPVSRTPLRTFRARRAEALAEADASCATPSLRERCRSRRRPLRRR